MDHNVRQSYILLHISVFLWGFTAILGGLISLSAATLVWWRVALSASFLLLWPGLINEVRSLSSTLLRQFIWIGIIVAIHWLCFYGSIKLANASVALITMSTTALFTSFLEPYILKTKIDKVDLWISLLVIPAMVLITNDFHEEMILGFWLGIVAALLLAYFTILNKKYIRAASPQSMTFVQMTSSWLFLSLCIPIYLMIDQEYVLIPNRPDLLYLILLSIGCTILPFVLHLKALKHISAFISNLIVNLEPVYGVIMAAIILKEYKELNIHFYLGGAIIVAIVMCYPFIKPRT